jgi:hypothetical protein
MRRERKQKGKQNLFMAWVVVVVLLLVLMAEPVAASNKIIKTGNLIIKGIFKKQSQKAEKQRRVERAKQYQRIRRDRQDWQIDCCELLKERIRNLELTIDDMKKIKDFIDWRLPEQSIFKQRKKPCFKNITQEIGYKIISDELTTFDYQLIFEKIKDPDYRPHWALSIWIALGDYGRETLQPAKYAVPNMLPAGL